MSTRTAKTAILLLLILSIAGFLRLHKLTSTPPGLFFDEAADGNNALEVVHTVPFGSGFKPFYPEDDGREGLYINTVAVLIKLTGVHEPWLLRLPAAISGILTVLGIYFLATRLFGSSVGLFSAFLLATSYWHLNFSRIAFRAIMAPLFLVWSLYFLLRGFDLLARGISVRRATFPHLLGGLLFGLGTYTYIAYRVSPALIALVLAYCWLEAKQEGWQIKFFGSAAIFLLSSVIVFLPLGYYFFAHQGSFLGHAGHITVWKSGNPLRNLARITLQTLAMFNIAGDPIWRHNLSGAPELSWPVGQLFLLGLFAAFCLLQDSARMLNGDGRFKRAWQRLFTIWNRDSFPVVVLVAWFFLGMLPGVLSNADSAHALRTILMIPPVIMFAALGGCWLYQRLHSRIRPAWLQTMAILLLAFVTASVYRSYFVVWARNPNVPLSFSHEAVELARELNSLPSETPKYVIVADVDSAGVHMMQMEGSPLFAQPVMFITDTVRPEEQNAKNIHYVLPSEENTIPAGAMKFYLRSGD